MQNVRRQHSRSECMPIFLLETVEALVSHPGPAAVQVRASRCPVALLAPVEVVVSAVEVVVRVHDAVQLVGGDGLVAADTAHGEVAVHALDTFAFGAVVVVAACLGLFDAHVGSVVTVRWWSRKREVSEMLAVAK